MACAEEYESMLGKRPSQNDIRIDQRDYVLMRLVIPVSDMIASLVNLTNDRSSIRFIEMAYKKGTKLDEMLGNIEGYGTDFISASLHWGWWRVHQGLQFRSGIAKELVRRLRESGVEPNDYLPIIKMDVIQGAYIGRFP